jgi:hypothetical protein
MGTIKIIEFKTYDYFAPIATRLLLLFEIERENRLSSGLPPTTL